MSGCSRSGAGSPARPRGIPNFANDRPGRVGVGRSVLDLHAPALEVADVTRSERRTEFDAEIARGKLLAQIADEHVAADCA